MDFIQSKKRRSFGIYQSDGFKSYASKSALTVCSVLDVRG